MELPAGVKDSASIESFEAVLFSRRQILLATYSRADCHRLNTERQDDFSKCFWRCLLLYFSFTQRRSL
jgi:hypothetical protein